MAAGARPGDAEMIRVDGPPGGVMADEADGAVDVGDDLREDEFRLRAVDDGEDRVAAREERRVDGGVDPLIGGFPPAADHIDDAVAVGAAGGLNHVEGEGDAQLVGIDDIRGAREVGGGSGTCERGLRKNRNGGGERDEKQRCEEAERAHGVVGVGKDRLGRWCGRDENLAAIAGDHRKIGGGEFEGGEFGGEHPAQGHVFVGVRRGTGRGEAADERNHGDDRAAVVVSEARQGTLDDDRAAEFLHDFADDGRLGRFGRLHFATGKFPLEGEVLVRGALGNQHAARVILDDGADDGNRRSAHRPHETDESLPHNAGVSGSVSGNFRRRQLFFARRGFQS